LHPSGSAHPAQQEQPASSPSIYFHHWQPPTSYGNAKDNQPATPTGIHYDDVIIELATDSG